MSDANCVRDSITTLLDLRQRRANLEEALAAWLFGGCPDHEQENLVAERSIGTSVDGCRTYDAWQRTMQKLETVLDIQFANMGNMRPNFGITANPGWPKALVNDPGFALLTDDPWYKQGSNKDDFIQYYKKEPDTQFTNSKVNQYSWGYTKPRGTSNNNNPPSDDDSDTDMPVPSDDEDDDPSFPGRRELDELNNGNRSPGDLVIREGNPTRRPTSEELFEGLGLLRCEDQYCQREMEGLGYASLPVVRETATSPARAEAVATASIIGSFQETTIEVHTSLSSALEIAAEVSDAVTSIITLACKYNPTI
ncbi:putative glycosyl hydrolase family 18 [Colletotrichum tabaci]|uniref:Glycosyl hydrolase family 18 n=1 Tax=Colletotrichum tabaci TaxID=1209068 RepID=A0AAV9TH86_9PEZI